MPDQWVANNSYEFSFTYLRRVTSKSGNQVLLDAPIPWTLDPANNADSWVQTTQDTGGDGFGYGFLISPACAR